MPNPTNAAAPTRTETADALIAKSIRTGVPVTADWSATIAAHLADSCLDLDDLDDGKIEEYRCDDPDGRWCVRLTRR